MAILRRRVVAILRLTAGPVRRGSPDARRSADRRSPGDAPTVGDPRCVRLFICPSPGESRSPEQPSGGKPATRSSSLPWASLPTGRRPLCRAGRPSRDLGFLVVSPSELWLCFRPSAPAVSDLSSCNSRPCSASKLALFGAFWGAVTSSGRNCSTPSPCPGWPAACASSWDKIPIVSFVESAMTRWESCPTIGPELASVIGSLLSPSSQPPVSTSRGDFGFWIGDFGSPGATWQTWSSSASLLGCKSLINRSVFSRS